MVETRPPGYTTPIQPWRISNEAAKCRELREDHGYGSLRDPLGDRMPPHSSQPAPLQRCLIVQCLPMLARISAPFFPDSTLNLGIVSRDSIIPGKFLLVRHPWAPGAVHLEIS